MSEQPEPTPEQRIRQEIIREVEHNFQYVQTDIPIGNFTPYLLVKVLDRLESIEALLAGNDAPDVQEEADESPLFLGGE